MAIVDTTTTQRKIGQARAALGFERIWAALHWPFVLVAALAALILSGVLPQFAALPRLAILIAAVLLFIWSLKPVLRVLWPSRQEAMRRVEEKSGLAHRPVSGHDDRLAAGAEDPLQQAIWEEHKLRQLRSLGRLKAGVPRSAWRDIDPRALRLPATLALVAALFLGPGDPRGNLADAITFTSAVEAVPLVVDAWLKPPAYTAKPPLLLTSPAMAERLKTEPDILTPEKATLALRITGATNPKLSFHELSDAATAGPEVTGLTPKTKFADGLFQSETVMTRPALVRVMDGTKEIAAWRIALIPDAPPTVAVVDLPAGDSSGSLSAKWKAGDDYGVSGITTDIYLADEQEDGEGFSSTGIFEYEPPKLAISLRKASPKEEAGTAKADLAEHPWAGFMVDMMLTAKDAAGNTADSPKVTFRMPERLFIKPLARALIEQRRSLILEPERSGHVVQMLDALLTYPKGLIEGSGTHIAIAAVMSRLSTGESQDDVATAIKLLWQIAVGVEEGSLADAKAELEALRQELERALREGASPERIAELMDKMRDAMNRYMQQMMEEAQRRMQQDGPEQDQQQGQAISPQDLQKMLDMIEKLAQSGNNEAAQQLLSELEDILRNLQPGGQQQQNAQRGDGPMSKMLNELSDLMRQQQQLMDETQRSPGQNSMEGDNGQEGQGMGELGDRQRGLGESLRRLMEQMGQNGFDPPSAFGEAGKSMQGAEGSLRQGDRDQALGDQGDAMSKLREGAQGLARQMIQQSQGQQGSQGRHGEARGDDRDPLGRPMPNRGEDFGPDDDMLPSELAIQRAREILEMLRSRAGNIGMPPVERDYIERLLRGLY